MTCGGYKYATNSRHHTHSMHSSLIRRSLDGMGKSSLIIRALFLAAVAAAASANFLTEVEFNWGDGRGKILNGGDLLELSLDRVSGSGFQSKKEYLFGRFDMRMKLVAGNSAGTVATYYLSSLGPTHDEIDFEFLGNLSNQPYVLHTNVYAHGKGDREQQFYLWFDPRLAFHTYSVLWNPLETVFYVDGTPIRVFRNLESNGVPYLKSQPMRLYASLWDGDDWATRGGLEKTDWSKAPFIASYQGFVADACVATPGRQPACSASRANWWNQRLDSVAAQKLKAVRDRYMIYDYCKDTKRYPNGFPAECAMPLV